MRLSLSQLKSGMVTAEDIHNHGGRKLLPKGTVLTERHIRNLKAWGIPEIVIEDDGSGKDARSSNKVDPKKMAAAKEEAKTLFAQANQEHPAVAEFMRLCTLKILKGKPGMGHINVK